MTLQTNVFGVTGAKITNIRDKTGGWVEIEFLYVAAWPNEKETSYALTLFGDSSEKLLRGLIEACFAGLAKSAQNKVEDKVEDGSKDE